ncbi:MAG TPA: DUF1192 domain-containing protein [Acetobacteraceae bacterium]|nr:DUF1192 domain-containing protein [Acetobacteraceae bacterium]
MMFDDETPAPRPPAAFVPLKLDGLGVAELEAYIAALAAEIERVRLTIGQRRGVHSAAEQIFRRPG